MKRLIFVVGALLLSGGPALAQSMSDIQGVLGMVQSLQSMQKPATAAPAAVAPAAPVAAPVAAAPVVVPAAAPPPAALQTAGILGQNTMTAIVTGIDSTSGTVDASADGSPLKLHFPQAALSNIKVGDRISIHLAFSKG
jgi:hypothetical protein